MCSGHIKVLGGPNLPRGPDVAQACTRRYKWDGDIREIYTNILFLNMSLRKCMICFLFSLAVKYAKSECHFVILVFVISNSQLTLAFAVI